MLRGMDPRRKSVLINKSLQFVWLSLFGSNGGGNSDLKVASLKIYIVSAMDQYLSMNPGSEKEAGSYLKFVCFLKRNRLLGISVSKDSFELDYSWFIKWASEHSVFKLYLGCSMVVANVANVALATLFCNVSPFVRVELLIESNAVDSHLRYMKEIRQHVDMIRILKY